MWATIVDLEDHLGLPIDDRMQASLDEALAWGIHKRPDLDPYTFAGESVRKAICIYAGLLYRERSTPQGIAGYDSEGGGFMDGTAYYRCLDMLGYKKPVAR